jgi:hypothetical protein
MDGGSATNNERLATEAGQAVFAVNCKSDPGEAVRAYVEAGIAPVTRRAYKADLEHFRAWGGDIPATDLQLAASGRARSDPEGRNADQTAGRDLYRS